MTGDPIVLVGPPCCGARVLAAALATDPQVQAPDEAGISFIDGVAGLAAAERGFESHRLTAADAEGRHADLRAALARACSGVGRPLLVGPRYALRVGLVAAAFPSARFVLVRSDASRALERSLDRWRAQATTPDLVPLPGWNGPPWTLPLVPGWRALDGLGLASIVRRQWEAVDRLLLDDLQALAPERWCAVSRPALIARPRHELGRLAGILGLDEAPAMADAVTAATRTAQRGRPGAPAPAAATTSARSGRRPSRRRDVGTAVHSLRFARVLARLGGAVVLAVPDLGALVTLELRAGHVGSVPHALPRAGGLAATPGRLVVAAEDGVLDLRRGAAGRFVLHERLPAAGRTLGEVVLAGDVPWAVVQAPYRGVARWDGTGFVEQWRVAQDGPGVGGLAVDMATVGWMTTLDGRLVDRRSGATVLSGLAAPRAPRLHDGRIWLVASGALACVDPGAGVVERVIELAGAVGGLTIHAGLALVGGRVGTAGAVWAVDLARGTVAGFARLADGSGPVRAVAALDGVASPAFSL